MDMEPVCREDERSNHILCPVTQSNKKNVSQSFNIKANFNDV